MAEPTTLNVNSTRYTIAFAAVVCVVCAALVSVTALSLQPRQQPARALCGGLELRDLAVDVTACRGTPCRHATIQTGQWAIKR